MKVTSSNPMGAFRGRACKIARWNKKYSTYILTGLTLDPSWNLRFYFAVTWPFISMGRNRSHHRARGGL